LSPGGKRRGVEGGRRKKGGRGGEEGPGGEGKKRGGKACPLPSAIPVGSKNETILPSSGSFLRPLSSLYPPSLVYLFPPFPVTIAWGWLWR